MKLQNHKPIIGAKRKKGDKKRRKWNMPSVILPDEKVLTVKNAVGDFTPLGGQSANECPFYKTRFISTFENHNRKKI